jgi:hypothetical protein
MSKICLWRLCGDQSGRAQRVFGKPPNRHRLPNLFTTPKISAELAAVGPSSAYFLQQLGRGIAGTRDALRRQVDGVTLHVGRRGK